MSNKGHKIFKIIFLFFQMTTKHSGSEIMNKNRGQIKVIFHDNNVPPFLNSTFYIL